MRVIVTGSRAWSDVRMLRAVLDDLLAQHGSLTVVHGAWPHGADAIADQWATEKQQAGADVHPEQHPANWGRYGRRAGPIRNGEMVAAGADLCVAFFQPGADNWGTSNCVKQARKARIRVVPYPRPDGAEL